MGPNNGIPKPGGHVDATQVSVAPSTEIPDSNVRRALERLGERITAAVTATAVAQYTADVAWSLAQVVRGEARAARLAARQARELASMGYQRAGIAQGEALQARRKAIAATAAAAAAQATANAAVTAAAVAQETADIGGQVAREARGGLVRLRLRVADNRMSAEQARQRAAEALAMSRDLRRRLSSEQIALSAAVFN